ncbi:MAG: tryptophan-rich sensory protein [Flavobacteriales bacterium]|nr:tryptophan-rich sensory protein [Flavobacteriales bacterium]
MNWKRLILFLILNFGALALGGLFTNTGVSSDWYVNMNQAPWTPPGWVFGAAWTFIMICFSFFMTFSYDVAKDKSMLITLFVVQWILNVGWNPVFFYYHEVLFGLIVISALTLLVYYFLFKFSSSLKWKALFILPYAIWLAIATSLNAYIYLYN